MGISGSLQRYCEAGEIHTRWSVPDRMSSPTMSCTAVLAIWLPSCSGWFERPSARRKASRLRRRRYVPAVTCEATGSRSISSSALNMVPITLHPATSRGQTRRIGLRHTYNVVGSNGSTEQHPIVDGPGFGEPSGGSSIFGAIRRVQPQGRDRRRSRLPSYMGNQTRRHTTVSLEPAGSVVRCRRQRPPVHAPRSTLIPGRKPEWRRAERDRKDCLPS